MLGKFQNITFRSLFFSVMPRSSSSCFSETKLYYIPDKHLALFFAFCCVFCPFLLLFQLQGIWSSLSRRFTPRHALTRLHCATNSFSALKLKITTSFLSFSPPSYLCRQFFSTEKLGLIFSFCHFPPSSHFVLIFCRLVLPPRQAGGHSPQCYSIFSAQRFSVTFCSLAHPRCAGTFANGATKTTNKQIKLSPNHVLSVSSNHHIIILLAQVTCSKNKRMLIGHQYWPSINNKVLMLLCGCFQQLGQLIVLVLVVS